MRKNCFRTHWINGHSERFVFPASNSVATCVLQKLLDVYSWFSPDLWDYFGKNNSLRQICLPCLHKSLRRRKKNLLYVLVSFQKKIRKFSRKTHRVLFIVLLKLRQVASKSEDLCENLILKLHVYYTCSSANFSYWKSSVDKKVCLF